MRNPRRRGVFHQPTRHALSTDDRYSRFRLDRELGLTANPLGNPVPTGTLVLAVVATAAAVGAVAYFVMKPKAGAAVAALPCPQGEAMPPQYRDVNGNCVPNMAIINGCPAGYGPTTMGTCVRLQDYGDSQPLPGQQPCPAGYQRRQVPGGGCDPIPPPGASTAVFPAHPIIIQAPEWTVAPRTSQGAFSLSPAQQYRISILRDDYGMLLPILTQLGARMLQSMPPDWPDKAEDSSRYRFEFTTTAGTTDTVLPLVQGLQAWWLPNWVS